MQACEVYAIANRQGNSVQALETASRLGMPKLRAQCLDDIFLALCSSENKSQVLDLHDYVGTAESWDKLDVADWHALLLAVHRWYRRFGYSTIDEFKNIKTDKANRKALFLPGGGK